MQTKPVRITEEAEQMAKKYGKSVSKGIVVMYNKCQQGGPNEFVSAGNFTADIGERTIKLSAGSFTHDYWKKIENSIDVAIEKVRGGY